MRVINLSHDATAINSISAHQLEQIGIYAQSLKFETFTYDGDWIFSANLPKKGAIIKVCYSESSPEDEIYKAHVYVEIDEVQLNMKNMKKYLKLIDIAYDIFNKLIEEGA
jgi:hypothetical protein